MARFLVSGDRIFVSCTRQAHCNTLVDRYFFGKLLREIMRATVELYLLSLRAPRRRRAAKDSAAGRVRSDYETLRNLFEGFGTQLQLGGMRQGGVRKALAALLEEASGMDA